MKKVPSNLVTIKKSNLEFNEKVPPILWLSFVIMAHPRGVFYLQMLRKIKGLNSFSISANKHLVYTEIQELIYPEMPMTIVGSFVPSFMMHQFSDEVRSSCSSKCSCCNMGTPFHLTSFINGRPTFLVWLIVIENHNSIRTPWFLLSGCTENSLVLNCYGSPMLSSHFQ